MILKDVQQVFHLELDALFGKEEVQSFFFMLCEQYFEIDRLTLALSPDIVISKEEESILFKALSKLQLGKPIQYILGRSDFFGMVFKVNKHTLIPRPETEELVQLVIDTVQQGTLDSHKILDIGTGSGCIAIALAKHFLKGEIMAIDISEKALQVAQKNAQENTVDIAFLKADILDSNFNMQPLKFDVIVSNPPYVRALEKAQMHANVLQYEPASALFVENAKPLLFYKAIAQFAKQHLAVNGTLFFEINEYLGTEMLALMRANGFKECMVYKDLFGKDRMLVARL